MSGEELYQMAQAISYWSDRLDMMIEELLEFLSDNQIKLDELWITLMR